jgi:hypothetical protein
MRRLHALILVAACITITSPTPGANLIRGTLVNVGFQDVCRHHWFECFAVDGVTLQCATPTPQRFLWNTSAFYSVAPHRIAVTSFTRDGRRTLGTAIETVNLVDVP